MQRFRQFLSFSSIVGLILLSGTWAHAADDQVRPASAATGEPSSEVTATSATATATPAASATRDVLTGQPIPASAAAAPAPRDTSTVALTPDQARRALGVLEDPQQRLQTIDALKAIAAAAPGGGGVALGAPRSLTAPSTVSLREANAPAVAVTTTVSAPASATGASATAAPAGKAGGASAASASAATPLEANGLIVQLLRQIAGWADGLGDQASRLARAVVGLPTLFAQTVHTLSTPLGRALLLKALASLAAVFIVGIGLQWLLHRLLQRPRRLLMRQAELSERRARERVAERVAQKRLRETAAQQAASAADARAADAHPATPSVAPDRKATEAVAARTAPAAAGGSDVALVRTVVDGEERVEAVPVDAGDGASGTAAAEVRSAAAEAADTEITAAKAVEGTDANNANYAANAAGGREVPPADRDPVLRAAEHWSTLRHLPFAAAALILDLLPLAVFFIAAGIVSRWVAGGNARVQDLTLGFVDAYLSTWVIMVVIRMLVSPSAHGVRLMQVDDAVARTVQTWILRIVVLAAFGVALANGSQMFGASRDGQLAFMKIVSLIVHCLVVVLIFRTRHSVSAMIAPRPDDAGATHALAGFRHWLSDIWPYFSSFVVMAIWVVWALGVEDGFPKLIHFIGVSMGVIVGVRLVGILILGGLGRIFNPNEGSDEEGNTAAAGRITRRYYPVARAVVSAILYLFAALALLEAWGFNAIGWFTRGPVGRNLTSAALTIAVAIIFALVVWEATNAGIERRLSLWTERGDTVRAARLRTLVPMMRTCLFIAILLVVGLTALNQIGVNTAPLLAGASIVGVALGFGSQKLVQDFITGIFLLMENAMQVGDWVTVAGVSGSVEYLSIRTVRLRAGDGSLHIVPFSSVSMVNNTNRGLGNAAVRVSVNYDADVDKVIETLKDIGASIRSDPAFKDMTIADLELWGVDAVDGATVTIAGQIRCLDKGRWGVQREFNRRMFERFRALGIDIANPRVNWNWMLTPPGAEMGTVFNAQGAGGSGSLVHPGSAAAGSADAGSGRNV